ncbi:uncharacterized protein J4E88_008202 [Alternaria novae-zelandiae]|uniref:uncharacterized protein n=1 Tax=Alternaria novae-zelandiae TaxID=430562 RepID=UPI0020C37663|nr:uncharacterized protein J4E88_008202 [Alternaria novae-zelandiae]KAI4674467.1 hypothetical protein J4E88_008202 [Alternaria novae-zelandiae]
MIYRRDTRRWQRIRAFRPWMRFKGKFLKLIHLTIKCGADIHRVHKIIVCKQVAFFTGALKFGGKEAQTDVIDLPEDEPNVIASLIEYLYTELAVKYFEVACQRFWDVESFSVAVDHVFSSTLPEDTGLRSIIIDTVSNNMVLMHKTEIRAMPSKMKRVMTGDTTGKAGANEEEADEGKGAGDEEIGAL